MKHIIHVAAAILFIACSPLHADKTSSEKTEGISSDSNSSIVSSQKEIEKKEATSNAYQISTYDDSTQTKDLTRHRESLKQLSDKKVFSIIHSKLEETLPKKQQEYLRSMLDYELLSVAKGDLFQENNEDYVFIVYDKKKWRIDILVYNKQLDNYFELYRAINVENGLKDANCNYSAYGSIDYQLANEIIYQAEFLVKKPESYLEAASCKITDLSKDKDFELKMGCLSKGWSRDHLSNALCISTSTAYNNWECLRYNKAKHSFVFFYGQAFSD